MKTGSLYLGFHTSKKCGLVRRVSAAAHEAYDFQMVCIGQLLFRELRTRNDGAVLLDSHTLRVVTQLLQQCQFTIR